MTALMTSPAARAEDAESRSTAITVAFGDGIGAEKIVRFAFEYARRNGAAISHRDILELLDRVAALGFDFIKTETLCTFDGTPGYSLGQSQ